MKNYKQLINVAGYDKEDIDINFQKIHGIPVFNITADNPSFGTKTTQIYPDGDVDPTSIEAEIKNGYLYINWNLPKDQQGVKVVIK